MSSFTEHDSEKLIPFTEYASEGLILEMLIKERAKVAIKNKLKATSPSIIEYKIKQGEKLSIEEHIFTMMPARNLWCRPQKRDRFLKDSNEAKTTKQILTRSIALAIKKHRTSYEKYPYLKRLDAFIGEIRKDITSKEPLKFDSLKIFGKKKKIKDGITILRPLCIFDSLREKLLVALASKYLTLVFDKLLHEEILSYRPLRIYHNGNTPILTNRDNAIDNIQHYRKVHKGKNIYVAECDIQKYFDTINHDIIRSCLSAHAKKIQESHPEFEYTEVERIIDAYLNSYSFYNNITIKNEKMRQEKQNKIYESPDKKLFIQRGCYTEEEFKASTHKIGIPQGGALSVLISNIVLSTVDNESILTEENDEEKCFCRYGDDIILMHTSKEKCKELIDKYCKKLNEFKLLYHSLESVTKTEYRRNNGTVSANLWNMKSRSPFLWGRDCNEKEQMDWIGFLGYEIRYTGEVRLRRSSLDDKFKNIKRKYYSGAKTLIAKGKSKKDIEAEILNRLERFKCNGFATAKSLNINKYCMTQALKLDSYTSKNLYRLLYKIARNNNLSNKQLAYWWSIAKESGCINNRRSYIEISSKKK